MKPKTFLDKEMRTNSNYFFISYSHKNSDLVYPILNEMFNKNVNFWYDKELKVGDLWNEEAKKILTDSHCVGAIVFVSKDTIASDAVKQEVEIINQLSASKNFRAMPVLIGGENLSPLIGKAIEENPDNLQLPLKLLHFINLLNNNTTIYHVYKNPEETASILTDIATKENALEKPILDTRKSNLGLLSTYIYNKKTVLKLGNYKFDEKETEKEITWILVNQKDNIYYFISEYVIDFIQMSDINLAINNIKAQFANIKFVADIFLIDEDFLNLNIDTIDDSIPTDYADKNRQQNIRICWVKCADNNRYAMYNSKNMKVNRLINQESINGGLRLILAIDNTLIELEESKCLK